MTVVGARGWPISTGQSSGPASTSALSVGSYGCEGMVARFLISHEHAGNRRIQKRGREAHEQRPAAQPGQVVPPIGSDGANATQLNTDRGKVGKAGQGEGG